MMRMNFQTILSLSINRAKLKQKPIVWRHRIQVIKVKFPQKVVAQTILYTFG